MAEKQTIKSIKKLYYSAKHKIISRLKEFKQLWKSGSDKGIFAELVFCLLTPQSKAKLCWAAVENLLKKNLLVKGNANQILKELAKVRFKYKKSEYIVEARTKFPVNGKISVKSAISRSKNVCELRDWLVKNVKGLGYKEASHFLRNIGFGDRIAILDRHILRNMKKAGVIDGIPENLSKKRYLETEEKLERFSKKINIPMSHLDLLLWYKETGEVFK